MIPDGLSNSVVLLDAYGKSFPPSSNPTIIGGCEISWVVEPSCVVTACCGSEVGCGEEVFVAEHSAGDVVGEWFHLFSDVF